MNVLLHKPCILLITELNAVSETMSSTEIMSLNILRGLLDSRFDVTLVAMCDESEQNSLTEVLAEYSVRYMFLPRRITRTKRRNKYEQFAAMCRSWLTVGPTSQGEIDAIRGIAREGSVLLSLSPSVDSICVCKRLLGAMRFDKYIQYWSDPIALAGVNPEGLGVKRLPYRMLESSILSLADEVVYGTETLLHYQKRLYLRQAHKMRTVDIAYIETFRASEAQSRGDDGRLRIAYCGDYNVAIRNPIPLFEAVSKLSDKVRLEVYGRGNVDPSLYPHVNFHGRVVPDIANAVEGAADVIVCLLNRACIQVPGKVFYRTNSDKPILVITDGLHKEEIVEYLESFGRFIFCDNTLDSIVRVLEKIDGMPSPEPTISMLRRLSPKTVSSEIVFGTSSSARGV